MANLSSKVIPSGIEGIVNSHLNYSTATSGQVLSYSGSDYDWIDPPSSGNASILTSINFNGTGTISIRQSANVSSITDRGTGQYTVTASTAMTSADHTTLASKADTYAGSVSPYNHAASGPVSTTAAWVEVGSNLSGNLTRGDSQYVGCVFVE